MMRKLVALALLPCLAQSARAQDMPLAQILIDGEGWKKAEGKPAKPKEPPPVKSRDKVEFNFGEGRALWAVDTKGPITLIPIHEPFAQTASCLALSPDHSTLFLAEERDDDPIYGYVWAIQLGRRKNGDLTLTLGAYCPLRTNRGKKGIAVTGLAVDRDGRIYAATEIGVQVFDPTGRLCGVLTPAAPGRPELLAFDGDRLTHWVGDVKYTRKLNTAGAQ